MAAEHKTNVTRLFVTALCALAVRCLFVLQSLFLQIVCLFKLVRKTWVFKSLFVRVLLFVASSVVRCFDCYKLDWKSSLSTMFYLQSFYASFLRVQANA